MRQRQTILNTGRVFRLVSRRTTRGWRTGEEGYLVQHTGKHATPHRSQFQQNPKYRSCGQGEQSTVKPKPYQHRQRPRATSAA